MSSAQFDGLTSADFFTSTHRISGQVQTGTKPLSDLLNDRSQSFLLVYNVYLSRLSAPGEIGAYAPVAYLAKENLSFVIVPSREVRLPEPSRFTSQEYGALATLPGFEVNGTFPGPPRFDLRAFSPASLEPFVALLEASVHITGLPDVTFNGEAVLVNRAHLEAFCLSE
jgi:hypothetical protein